MDVAIDAVPIAEKPVLARLLELYIYDFSEFMGWDVGDDGRFGYRYLDHYWTEGNRFPYLIRAGGKLAGFALVHVEEIDGKSVTSMAEFFVMRKYRRQGVGETVAARLFDQFPGEWHVSQIQENVPAQRFWRRLIAAYTGGDFTEASTDRRIIQSFRAGARGEPASPGMGSR